MYSFFVKFDQTNREPAGVYYPAGHPIYITEKPKRFNPLKFSHLF